MSSAPRGERLIIAQTDKRNAGITCFTEAKGSPVPTTLNGMTGSEIHRMSTRSFNPFYPEL